GARTLTIEDPAQSEPLTDRSAEAGSAARIVRENVTRLNANERAAIRTNVESSVASAADLEARGQAAAENFFIAKKEGNALKVESAMEEIERVINAQRAAHFESTFVETRGFLQAVQDFDMAGQFGDFEINAHAIEGA